MGTEPEGPHDMEHPDTAEVPPDERIGETLRALLGPGADLRPRAAERIDRRLHGESVTSMLASLGGIGWETVRLFLTNPPERADGEDGHG